MSEQQKCRICGCTENNCEQCIRQTGKPCHWVEDDLCSACADSINNHKNRESMNFFQQLSQQAELDITLRIFAKNGKLTVQTTAGSIVSHQQPYVVTGTPEELDEQFFSTILPDALEIKGLVSNAEGLKKDLRNSKTKTEMNKANDDAKGDKKGQDNKKGKAGKEKTVNKKAVKKSEEKPAPVEGDLFAKPAEEATEKVNEENQ